MAKKQTRAEAVPNHHVFWVDPIADILRSESFCTIEEVVTHIARLKDDKVDEIKVCRGDELSFGGVELSKRVKLAGKVYSLD